MVAYHYTLLLVLAYCVTCFQALSNLTNETDVVEKAFNNAYSIDNHLYRRVDIVFDPDNVASQAVWRAAMTNADRLSCLMRRTNRDAGKILHDKRNPPSAQSLFNDVFRRDKREKALQDWGWHELPPVQEMRKWKEYWGWLEARIGLGIHDGTGGRHDQHVRLGHFNPNSLFPIQRQLYVGPDRKTYRASGAIASFMNDHNGHMIFISGSRSVQSAFQTLHNTPFTPEDLPQLRYLSDLIWLYWRGGRRFSQEIYKDVRYFAVARINTLPSHQLIAYAMRQRGITGEIPEWPGVSFTSDEEGGKALIGSLGMSCAQFLFARKPWIGIKHIYKVVVFRDSNWYWFPQVIFYIQNVPANLLIPLESSRWQPYPPGSRGDTTEPEAESMDEMMDDMMDESMDDMMDESMDERGYERDSNGNYVRSHFL